MAGWPRVGKEQTIQKHLDSTHIRERHTTTPLHATYPGSQALSLSTDLPSHKALLTTVSTAPTSLVPHLGTMQRVPLPVLFPCPSACQPWSL